jgi:putative membrane protein
VIRRFLLTWVANFLGLLVAATFLKGINADSFTVLIIASLIFGLVNALLRPTLIILSLPAIVLTSGLFSLIINTLLLYITSAIYRPFRVETVWAALAAVVVVWLANYAMEFIIDKEKI